MLSKLLYFFAFLLGVAWLIAFFGYDKGGAIHLLLVGSGLCILIGRYAHKLNLNSDWWDIFDFIDWF